MKEWGILGREKGIRYYASFKKERQSGRKNNYWVQAHEKKMPTQGLVFVNKTTKKTWPNIILMKAGIYRHHIQASWTMWTPP